MTRFLLPQIASMAEKKGQPETSENDDDIDVDRPTEPEVPSAKPERLDTGRLSPEPTAPVKPNGTPAPVRRTNK